MKLFFALRRCALLVGLVGPLLFGQGAGVEAPAGETAADAAIEAELKTLVAQVKTRLQAGAQTEAELAPELQAFDALLAKHAGEKTDAVAMVAYMKAALYLQVFEDNAGGLAQLRQVVKDFPETELGKKLPEMIEGLEKQAEADALTAVGKVFAPFKETATDDTVIDLEAYRGKVVLVDFWATWCGPCVDELPNVLAAYKAHHADGFEVIGISLDKDGAKLAAFTQQQGMSWPQIFDGQGWQNKLAQAYGIRSIPATFLLDREGKIIAKGLRGEALSRKVAEALGKSAAQ